MYMNGASFNSIILCFCACDVFYACCMSNAFSALSVLVGYREEHAAVKNCVLWCWCRYMSGARCKWFAYGPANATATPSSVASLKSRSV